MAEIKKILPPYGKFVETFSQDAGLIVCTGSDAWTRVKSKTWINGMPKVVMPFGENPDRYKWPASGREVMICGIGQQENYQRLIKISRCVLQHGAKYVVWALPDYPITKFERSRPKMKVA